MKWFYERQTENSSELKKENLHAMDIYELYVYSRL